MMSSSNNSNLPIQPLPMPSYPSSATNSCPQSASETVNPVAGKQQQQQRNSRNFSDQSYRGRSGRSRRGRDGAYTRPDNLNRSDDQSQASVVQDLSNETQVNAAVGGHQSARGRGQRSALAGGSGGARNRPRQQASRRIEDIEGLDIDLDIDPIGGGNELQPSGRGRHTVYGRKVNLTHLLNYRIDRKHPGGRTRNSPSFGESGNTVQRNNYGHYRDSGTAHKFSKQQFLQANCQFVVLNGPDYTIHRANPDWPVDWDCIEEVKFRQIASTETTCPVCLEPPVAAKITRCGHIYCWTCMLQYLSLSDENCRQCPICFEPVYSNDLRSVVSECYANHAVDEEIVMKLMIRTKGCVLVQPYWKQYLDEPRESSTSANINEHYKSRANLVIVDAPTVIEKVALREKAELLFKLETDRNEPEVCFIEQAIKALNERIDKLRKISPSQTETRAKQANSTSQIQSSSGEISMKNYLFYQSADGQHIYLNPFSTKILCHEYGSLEACPLELKAKVLQMDWVSMSDGWRKRFKYLEHLPSTCEFRLIEIDFDQSDLVSSATYQVYRDQINSRARERERRAREERKREKIIQVEQNRRIYGIQPMLKINLNNIEQFPSVSDERYLGLTKQRNQGREDDDSDENSNHENESDQAGNNNNNIDRPLPIGQTLQQEQQPAKGEESVVDVALSFRDIQLQEAMKEAKLSGKGQPLTGGGWGAKKSGLSTATTTTAPGSSSSFAKLLVDAKSSQREWTKNVGNSSSSTANNVMNSASSHRQKTQSFCSASDNDGADEELRVPPSRFNIGDFLDTNVVSGPGKRAKGKPKNSSITNKK